MTDTCNTTDILLNKPFAVMGIVNVTPDSFYDGGKRSSVSETVEHALKLRDEGADILDIGGVSTRPGAAEVSVQEELDRVLPVVEKVVSEFEGPVSVDTTSADVAEAVLECGVSWINDISAGRFDVRMKDVVAGAGCHIVLMHSRGKPETMQKNVCYSDVVYEVKRELQVSIDSFLDAGVAKENIILDPGFGFAKKTDDNIALLKGLSVITEMGYTVLVGTSRKSFVGEITGRNPGERLSGSLATVASAYIRGARIFRVHDVGVSVDMLKVLSVIENDISVLSSRY